MFQTHEANEIKCLAGVMRMNAVSLASLPHMLSSLAFDDGSLALIALLIGMAGGWTLTGWREQIRAKKAAKSDPKP